MQFLNVVLSGLALAAISVAQTNTSVETACIATPVSPTPTNLVCGGKGTISAPSGQLTMITAATIQACAAGCEATKDCLSFTFHGINGLCHLWSKPIRGMTYYVNVPNPDNTTSHNDLGCYSFSNCGPSCPFNGIPATPISGNLIQNNDFENGSSTVWGVHSGAPQYLSNCTSSAYPAQGTGFARLEYIAGVTPTAIGMGQAISTNQICCTSGMMIRTTLPPLNGTYCQLNWGYPLSVQQPWAWGTTIGSYDANGNPNSPAGWVYIQGGPQLCLGQDGFTIVLSCPSGQTGANHVIVDIDAVNAVYTNQFCGQHPARRARAFRA